MKKIIFIFFLLCSTPAWAVDYTADVNCMGAWKMTIVVSVIDTDSNTLLDTDGNEIIADTDGSEIDLSGEGETLTETSGTIPTSTDVPVEYTTTSRDLESSETEFLMHADNGSTAIDGADQALSICAWAKPESLGNENTIAAKMGSPGWQYGIYFANRGVDWAAEMFVSINLVVVGGDYANASSEIGAVSAGTWVHVCGVYNDTDIRVYIDGILSGNPVGFTKGIVDGAADFTIGSRDDVPGPEYFDGLLDEVIIFDRELTATEVSNIYNYGIDGTGGLSSVFNDMIVEGGFYVE